MSLEHSLKAWRNTTAALPWGVQRVMHDTLTLVADGKVHLVHSRDYNEGSPCLVNAVGQMLQTSGGSGIPGRYYGPLVSLFDTINSKFQRVPGYNDPHTYEVSPEVATVLVRYFAPLKDVPTTPEQDAAYMQTFAEEIEPYREPTDEELLAEWKALEAENEVKQNGPVSILRD